MLSSRAGAQNGGVTALAELLADTVEQLEGLPDESLGVWKQSRGIGRLRAAPTLQPAGRAWRLGVLLIDRHGNLFETGEVTRAIEPQVAVTSRTLLAEERREIRRAAARGKFPEGEVVNHSYTPIDVDELARAGTSGPLILENGIVRVRWKAGDGTRPLDAYLHERIGLLREG